jgi:hypothetical protein
MHKSGCTLIRTLKIEKNEHKRNFNHSSDLSIKYYCKSSASKAINYVRELTELTNEGTYRLEAGYSGAYVEYLQPLGKRFKISFNVLSGRGVAQYRYHKDFTAGLEWYEEFIDRDHFVVLQPGARFYATIGGKWWAALEASYTTTSPLQIKGAKENFLEGANVGLSINYGIF